VIPLGNGRPRLRRAFALLVLAVIVCAAAARAAPEPELDRIRADYERQERTGHYREAAPLGRRCVELLRASAPTDSAALATVLLDLGRTLARAGENDEAERTTREALTLRLALRGDQHPDVADALVELATRTIEYRDALAEVDSLLDRAASIQAATLDTGDVAVARTLLVRGRVRANQGRFDDATTALSRGPRDLRRARGRTGPRDLRRPVQLHIVRSRQRFYSEALQYARRALVTRRALLGADHPLVAEAEQWTGMSYKNQGDHARALTLLENALATRRRYFPDTHPEMLESWGNIASSTTTSAAMPMRSTRISSRSASAAPCDPTISISVSSTATSR
jgi:tetratricopeptide (TPR) repeat protein